MKSRKWYKRRSRRHRRLPSLPPLRLTPYAWAKLLFLRDLGETEVGGFGVSVAGDLLLVEDVHLVQQRCSSVTVKFDDSSVADFFDQQVDQGRTPEQFGRIWIHTHPGDSSRPSCIDEDTFARCFGSSNWAVMFILARGGQTYARLRFNAGPGGELVLPVEIDFEQTFPAANPAAWQAEYRQMVSGVAVQPHQQSLASPVSDIAAVPMGFDRSFRDLWLDGLPAEFPLEPFDERFR